MGNTFGLLAGGVDAVEGKFGDGRAPAVCRPLGKAAGDGPEFHVKEPLAGVLGPQDHGHAVVHPDRVV